MKEKSLTKPCSTCGADIAKNAKACPNCGAKNKKPIFKKWWFWAIIVVVVLSLGGLGGEDTSEDTVAGDTQNDTAAGDTQKDAPEATKEVEKVFAIGDTITVGKLAFQITNVTEQTAFDSGNQYIDDVVTSGKFIVVDATITNNDTEARTFDDTMFTLVDSQGREFDTYSSVELMMILEDKDLFLEQCNPGMSRSGVFVFEVPADVATYDLQISGGFAFSSLASETVKLK